jgi:hypothetical protein
MNDHMKNGSNGVTGRQDIAERRSASGVCVHLCSSVVPSFPPVIRTTAVAVVAAVLASCAMEYPPPPPSAADPDQQESSVSRGDLAGT